MNDEGGKQKPATACSVADISRVATTVSVSATRRRGCSLGGPAKLRTSGGMA